MLLLAGDNLKNNQLSRKTSGEKKISAKKVGLLEVGHDKDNVNVVIQVVVHFPVAQNRVKLRLPKKSIIRGTEVLMLPES